MLRGLQPLPQCRKAEETDKWLHRSWLLGTQGHGDNHLRFNGCIYRYFSEPLHGSLPLGEGACITQPSVFPSGEPGVSGDFWGSQEGCQGPSRPSGLSNSFVTPGAVAHQAPGSRGFSSQEYWSGLPCPAPGDLPNPCWASQVALVVKNPPANAGDRRCRFNPWDGKIPWRRAWQPTPVFLTGEFQGQRNLADCSPPRDPRRDSRGEQSPLLPLEPRPDYWGESGMGSRDPCRPCRGNLGPGHKPK